MQTRRHYHKIRIAPNTRSLDTAFNLLLDILRRPSLGRYVRHIEVHAGLPIYVEYTHRESQRIIGRQDRELLQSAVRKAGFAAEEYRILNMLMQRMVSYETLLRQPEREADEIWRPGEVQYPLNQLLRRVSADPTAVPYLQNLRECYILNEPESSLDDDRFYLPMEFFQAFTAIGGLPAIESVATDALEGDVNEEEGLELASSNISEIHIQHSSVSSAYLTSLICSCKTLKVLRFSVGGRATLDRSQPMFFHTTVMRALLFHKRTLE
ncbi:hypothetical protein BDW74DRAFT_160557 [Aspergillus multicolor]|uniref:uncharacterized protein n=1 Tax=Aspergillus multicolor TaxID=41759 RepID=UPI003CCD07ED